VHRRRRQSRDEDGHTEDGTRIRDRIRATLVTGTTDITAIHRSAELCFVSPVDKSMRRQCSRRRRASHPAAERPSHLLLLAPLSSTLPALSTGPISKAILRLLAHEPLPARVIASPSSPPSSRASAVDCTVGQSRTVRAPASAVRTRRWMPSWMSRMLLPSIMKTDRKTNRIVQGEQTPTIDANWMNADQEIGHFNVSRTARFSLFESRLFRCASLCGFIVIWFAYKAGEPQKVLRWQRMVGMNETRVLIRIFLR